MTTNPILSIITFFSVTATGCSQIMGEPPVQQNLHPRQRHEITVRIDDAPGPFDSVEGKMQFHIANADSCVPQDPISGAHPISDYDVPFTLVRVGDNEFRGVIYTDLVEDGNYYGLDTCHWEFASANISMKSHGVLFGSGIGLKMIISGGIVTRYMPKRFYFGSRLPDMFIIGETMSDEKSLHRGDYFSITLTARDETHDRQE